MTAIIVIALAELPATVPLVAQGYRLGSRIIVIFTGGVLHCATLGKGESCYLGGHVEE